MPRWASQLTIGSKEMATSQARRMLNRKCPSSPHDHMTTWNMMIAAKTSSRVRRR